MIICDVITNKQMRRDSSKFKCSIQAKFSTNTGQQNVSGDVTVLQNSQLIVKSIVRHDFLIETFCVCVPIFAHRSVVRWKSKYTKAENTEIGSLRSGYSKVVFTF